MTYTVVNPHACYNGPRPEDAHAAARPPPHPHAAPHLTNIDRRTGRPIAGRQQTGPPKPCSSKDATAHPHQPGARPDPPRPAPARSGRHPAKVKVRSPLGNRIENWQSFLLQNPSEVYRWVMFISIATGNTSCTAHTSLSSHVVQGVSEVDPYYYLGGVTVFGIGLAL
jgi:hypothetical protein